MMQLPIAIPELMRATSVGPFAGMRLGQYNVIEADPPWAFKTRSDKGMGRSADMHYPCMSLNEIKALPVATLAAKDCFLFLWTTGPFLPRAFEVMHAWGFAYSGVGFTWAKLRRKADPEAINARSWHVGMGYTTRKNTEMCLIGRRGQPKRQSAAVRELIVAPVREHSRKPDECYERIREFAAGPRAALFTREAREGFDCWGNQHGKFDNLPMQQELTGGA